MVNYMLIGVPLHLDQREITLLTEGVIHPIITPAVVLTEIVVTDWVKDIPGSTRLTLDIKLHNMLPIGDIHHLNHIRPQHKDIHLDILVNQMDISNPHLGLIETKDRTRKQVLRPKEIGKPPLSLGIQIPKLNTIHQIGREAPRLSLNPCRVILNQI